MQYFWIAMLMIAFLLLFLLQKRWFGKPDTSRAAQLAENYRVMTPDLLCHIPDDELIEAIVGNLLAKTAEKGPTPYQVIPSLSPGRCAVYSVWLFGCEQRAGSLECFCRGADAGFAFLAADGLSLFGCSEASALLSQYLDTKDDSLLPKLQEAVAADNPASHMISYIRDNPADFCDEGVPA